MRCAVVVVLGLGLAIWPVVGRSEPSVLAVASPSRDSASAKRSSSRRDPADSAAADSADAVVVPHDWMPSHGRECARKGRRKGFCQGPRKVPLPHGEEAALAKRLGLGTLTAAGDLLFESPKPEWIEAAGEPNDETLLWPVEQGSVWRGLQRPHRTKSGFHHRHKGVDIGAPEGALIRAVKSGIVGYSDNGVHGYGNLLVTIHPDGSVAAYGHCRAIYVFAGQHVKRGQVVGEVGHTGVARGSHLHFEYREHGRLRDPLRLFAERPDA